MLVLGVIVGYCVTIGVAWEVLTALEINEEMQVVASVIWPVACVLFALFCVVWVSAKGVRFVFSTAKEWLTRPSRVAKALK